MMETQPDRNATGLGQQDQNEEAADAHFFILSIASGNYGVDSYRVPSQPTNGVSYRERTGL